MLERTMHPTFNGYVVARNICMKDDLMFVDATAEERSQTFYVKGGYSWKDKNTEEHVRDCLPGDFFSNTTTPVGIFVGKALDDQSIFYCFDPKLNNKTAVPELTPLSIDSQITLIAGTKLFLCEGTIKVKDKDISGPARIKFAFDTVVSCVGTPAYGLIFP